MLALLASLGSLAEHLVPFVGFTLVGPIANCQILYYYQPLYNKLPQVNSCVGVMQYVFESPGDLPPPHPAKPNYSVAEDQQEGETLQCHRCSC